jgi:hypothetical protein
MSKDAKPITMGVDDNEEKDDKSKNKVFSRLLSTLLKKLQTYVWLFASWLHSCLCAIDYHYRNGIFLLSPHPPLPSICGSGQE